MTPMIKRLVPAAADLLSLSVQPAAQSLADAARRAEEQRKAAGGSAPTITNKDLPGEAGVAKLLNEYFLTDDLFTAYRWAWEAIMKLRTRSIPIDTYLMKWEVEAKSALDLEAPYGQEPQVARILDEHELTPNKYFMTELAVGRAMEDSRLTKIQLATLPQARQDNVKVVLTRNEGINWRSRQESSKTALEEARRIRPRK